MHSWRSTNTLVKRGLTPADAIQCATVNASELLGWENQVGNHRNRKFADLIAVDGDPLANVTVLQHVKFVMKGGVIARNDDDTRIVPR